MKTLVIIPTYLEAENIADVLGKVRTAAPHVDILVVDDTSPDGTADLARAAAAELGQVDVLARPGKGGLGVAYRAGFQHAFANDYEVVVQMDADLSHPPERLPALLAKVDEGADIAIGSRYVKGGATANWPLVRKLLSRSATSTPRLLLGLGVHDATAGFRAYRADILSLVEASATKATGYGFQVELSYRAHRLGAKIVEVPDHLQRPRPRRVEDVVAHHRRGHVAGHLVGAPRPRAAPQRADRQAAASRVGRHPGGLRDRPGDVSAGFGARRRRARRPRGPRARRRGRRELTDRPGRSHAATAGPSATTRSPTPANPDQ